MKRRRSLGLLFAILLAQAGTAGLCSGWDCESMCSTLNNQESMMHVARQWGPEYVAAAEAEIEEATNYVSRNDCGCQPE